MATVLVNSHLPSLKLLSKGKVRDIYATSDPDALLFVATDRISAYDVILKNGIPRKGVLLTQLSRFWFDYLRDVVPNHLLTSNIDEMPEEVRQCRDQLDGRTMLVRKASVVPLEAIVRGYLTGSAWSEYKRSGTVHGIPFPAGLVESQKLPEPLFTPSTKAEQGAHDENIHPTKLVGAELYARISKTAIDLYKRAQAYALTRGLILADTKFEFGLYGPEKELILIDEALTPDSSRYWPAADYELGRGQASFDKQFLRDWLVAQGFRKGLESGPEGHEGEGWIIDEEVVRGTSHRYQEAVDMLTKAA
ncbi:phosphoribosylaminoimidazole-succinocarboxamide synthase [Auriculariales sp. MPI-PUGE-AT-0066]|nr:phosphoribosylaminoimidazole-succinocarboxamide synthase [Auriculariales sp. MPI-PUGE-AT-0066]